MWRWLFNIVLAGIVALLLRAYVFDVVSIASGSMEPTLEVGTHYIVNKLAFRRHSPCRGDIVMLDSPVEPGIGLVKRVIAMGGDHIALRNKQVILNGEILQEPYAVHSRPDERLMGDTIGEMTVPAHEAFVLGDNRDQSNDSTVWKDPRTGERIYFVSENAIKGRLVIP